MEAQRHLGCAGITEQLHFNDHAMSWSDWVAKRKALQVRLTTYHRFKPRRPKDARADAGNTPAIWIAANCSGERMAHPR